MDEPRPNHAFDRELRRALAAEGGAPSGSHVDADVAAAWMERRLDAAAQRTVDAHLAGCTDCQTLLATLARITPAEDAFSGAERTWWRRLRAGWLVPAAVAAAAALVIWVAVPQQRQASERVQSSAPFSSAPPAQQTPAAPPAAADQDPNRLKPLAETAPPPAPSTVAPRATDNLERLAPLIDAGEPPAPQPPPVAAPPAVALPAAPPAESDKASAKLEAEAPRLEARRDSLVANGESPAIQTTPRQAAGGASLRAPDSSARVAGPSPVALTVVSADGGARWRRSAGSLEFAQRGNIPFTAVTLPIAADAITAGSSPGGTVCWLVGRAGAVLVSTDGRAFTRVPAPAPVDFVAVTATDSRIATVTAVGGRRFRTADAGATWTPLP